MENSETLRTLVCHRFGDIMDSSRANDQTGPRSLTRDSTTAKDVQLMWHRHGCVPSLAVRHPNKPRRMFACEMEIDRSRGLRSQGSGCQIEAAGLN